MREAAYVCYFKYKKKVGHKCPKKNTIYIRESFYNKRGVIMKSLFDGIFIENERIEYMVDLGYGKKDWDMVSALRELFANMLDTKTNYRFEYFKDKGYGEIEDSSEGLPLKSLVFGGTIKADDSNTIGVYGEGMKMAFITSLRLGNQISIQTVGFGIEAETVYSDKYQSDLMYLILNNNTREKGTLIRVKCSENDWNNTVDLFLQFREGYEKINNRLYLPGGVISIQGVKIDEFPNLYFSYNLDNKNLTNRDRNAVKMKEFKPIMQQILENIKEEKAIEVYLRGMESHSDCEEYRVELTPRQKLIWKRVALRLFGENAVYSNGFENDIKAKYKKYTIIPTYTSALKSLFKKLDFKGSDEVIAGLKTKNISIEENNKLTYSISEKYIKNWNIRDAGRELFANAIDEVGYEAECYFKNNCCVIADKGRGLADKSFIFGDSDKVSESPIGKHGEGLKLALLVLTRENRKVKVYSKGQVYIPKLEYNEVYKQNSFVIYKEPTDIVVEGTKILFESTEEEVNSIRNLFLEFKQDVKKVVYGGVDVITSEQGNIYICGVYVDSKPLAFSYNFNENIVTARDRNTIKRDKIINKLKPVLQELQYGEVLDKFLVKWKENPKYMEYDIEIVPKYFDNWIPKIKELYPNSCVADILDLRSNFIAAEAGYTVLQGVPKYLKELFAKVLGSSVEIAKTCDEMGIMLKDKIILTFSPHLVERMTKEKAIAELVSNAIDAGITLPKLTVSEGFILIEDDGKGLNISNLSLGNSNSYANSSASGTFGEGLKLSSYYIVRETHCNLEIETVGMTIQAEVKKHKESKSDLLIFTWVENDREIGTKIRFKGTFEELEKAKEWFLVYNKSKYTEVSENIYLPGGNIFINGVLSGTLSDLYYTYNLTGFNVKKIIDRDRENLGSDKLTPVLLEFLRGIKEDKVIENILFNSDFELDKIADNWDTFANQSVRAKYRSVIGHKYGSSKLCLSTPFDSVADRIAKEEGYYVISFINDSLRKIMVNLGYPLSKEVVKTAGRSQYETVIENEVYYSDLTDDEKIVWDNLKDLVVTEYTKKVWDKIHICDKFKETGIGETKGCYFSQFDVIFILRSLLKKNNMADLIGVVVHEIIHMETSFNDCTRDFENALTSKIGKLYYRLYSSKFSWQKRVEPKPLIISTAIPEASTVKEKSTPTNKNKLREGKEKFAKELLIVCGVGYLLFVISMILASL